MTDFCIQIHPDRCVDLDMADVRAVCDELAKDNALLRRFACTDGTDDRYYVNLMFETERPKQLWMLLRRRLFDDAVIGPLLRVASMAMCEGRHGWDDYRLLHHYDPAVPCDESGMIAD